MSGVSTIPEHLRDEVLKRAALGQSSRSIAAWLQGQGVTGDHSKVARFIKAERGERSELTKAIVTEHIARTLPGALDRRAAGTLRVADRLQVEIDEYKGALTGDDYTSLLDSLVKVSKVAREIIDTKLKYSGAGEQDTSKAPRPVFMLPPESDD
jgi:hypothetical protein